jgi:SAM-dependent methyltransferase
VVEDFDVYQNEVDRYFNALPARQFESIKCIFCGPSAKRFCLFENTQKTFLIYRCECGFVYSGYQPKLSALIDFYSHSEAMTTWSNRKKTAISIASQKQKYDRAIDFLQSQKVSSILDIGCGNGVFLRLAQKAIKDVKTTGIEQSKAAIKVCFDNGIEVFDGSPERFASLHSNERFDCVALWGVLEHLKDPRSIITLIQTRLLKLGGYLLICVPNVDSLIVRMLWDKCSTFTYQHLWYFNLGRLSTLLHNHSFAIRSYYSIENESVPIAKKLSGLHPYKEAPSFLNHEINELKDLIDPYVEKNNLGYKIVMIAQ